MNSSAASAAIGTSPSRPARATTASSTTSACTTAAIGERAPLRILVAVRAMAAVAVMPPNSGATMLPSPWPINSALGSCRVRVRPSDTTAQSSDSIAPSMAMAKAGPSSARSSAKSTTSGSPSAPGSRQGAAKLGAIGGIPLPVSPCASQVKREAMVSTRFPVLASPIPWLTA